MITNLEHGTSQCGKYPDGQLSWMQMYDNNNKAPKTHSCLITKGRTIEHSDN